MLERTKNARRVVLVVSVNSSAWSCMQRYLKRMVVWMNLRHLLRRLFESLMIVERMVLTSMDSLEMKIMLNWRRMIGCMWYCVYDYV